MSPEEKFKVFLATAKILNTDFDCVPVLYGSLGLWQVAKHSFEIKDIDILVPDNLIENDWPQLKISMENIGYVLNDLHEHEFIKDGQKVAFGEFSAIYDDLNIDVEKLRVTEISDITFKELSLEQYLVAYKYVLHDSYRKNSKQKNDQEKISFIEEQLRLQK